MHDQQNIKKINKNLLWTFVLVLASVFAIQQFQFIGLTSVGWSGLPCRFAIRSVERRLVSKRSISRNISLSTINARSTGIEHDSEKRES